MPILPFMLLRYVVRFLFVTGEGKEPKRNKTENSKRIKKAKEGKKGRGK